MKKPIIRPDFRPHKSPEHVIRIKVGPNQPVLRTIHVEGDKSLSVLPGLPVLMSRRLKTQLKKNINRPDIHINNSKNPEIPVIKIRK